VLWEKCKMFTWLLLSSPLVTSSKWHKIPISCVRTKLDTPFNLSVKVVSFVLVVSYSISTYL